MNFDLSPDQILLRDSVERVASGKARGNEAMWAELTRLGIPGMVFDEDHGGIGAGPVEIMLVMEMLGQGCISVPFLTGTLLCGGLVSRLGSAEQQADLLPRIADGSLRLALADQDGGLATASRARARRDGDGWILDGHKTLVFDGGGADRLLVTACAEGAGQEPTLFVVDPGSPGIARRIDSTHDGATVADILLDGVRLPGVAVVGRPGGAADAISEVENGATAAICAEAVGAMTALHRRTVEYLKLRKQFGVPIGSFQALQHRAVDMLIALEGARSLMLYATLMLNAEDPDDRRRAVSAAKIQVNRATRFIGQQAVQLHGGIAMTSEYEAGRYFKRLTLIERQFGDTDFHAARLDRLDGLADL